jgi:hypothetical protein
MEAKTWGELKTIGTPLTYLDYDCFWSDAVLEVEEKSYIVWYMYNYYYLPCEMICELSGVAMIDARNAINNSVYNYPISSPVIGEYMILLKSLSEGFYSQPTHKPLLLHCDEDIRRYLQIRVCKEFRMHDKGNGMGYVNRSPQKSLLLDFMTKVEALGLDVQELDLTLVKDIVLNEV